MSYGVSSGAREIGFGWRLEPEPAADALDLSMAIRASLREGAGSSAPADRRLDIEIRLRW